MECNGNCLECLENNDDYFIEVYKEQIYLTAEASVMIKNGLMKVAKEDLGGSVSWRDIVRQWSARMFAFFDGRLELWAEIPGVNGDFNVVINAEYWEYRRGYDSGGTH